MSTRRLYWADTIPLAKSGAVGEYVIPTPTWVEQKGEGLNRYLR